MNDGTRRALTLICAGLIIFAAARSAQSQSSHPVKTQPHPYPETSGHPGPAWLIDVAPQAGLTMQNVNGDPDTKQYIIETTGSGVAIIDYDRDGWPDIFLLNGTSLDGERGRCR